MTEHEYNTALKRVETLMDAEPGTPECAELDALAKVYLTVMKLSSRFLEKPTAEILPSH
jgi:hypothetical protein